MARKEKRVGSGMGALGGGKAGFAVGPPWFSVALIRGWRLGRRHGLGKATEPTKAGIFHRWAGTEPKVGQVPVHHLVSRLQFPWFEPQPEPSPKG